MKTALFVLILSVLACKPSQPEAEPAPAAVPAAENPADQNKVEKYVAGLQEDVKRAEEAKKKADAANSKAKEAEKLPE